MDQRRSREQMREDFKKRLQEENNRKDGGYYANLFRTDITIPFFNCKDGWHTIDIVDYIGGERDAYPNQLNWVFEFYTYNNLGAGKGSILSLSKTFGLPDPIAEEWTKMIRNGADQKKLRAKYDPPAPRALFNIICADNKEEEMKGIQVFHTSSYLLTDYLREMAKIQIRPGMEGIDTIVDFCDPQKGKSIKFKREGMGETTKFILHQFVDRPPGFEISQKLLDSVFVLGDLIHIPTYEEVCEYYWGKGNFQPGAESLGLRSSEEGIPTRFNRNQDVPASVGEPPVSTRETATARSETRQEPIKGPETESMRGMANLCPSGHAFGKDIDKFSRDCEPCPKWKDCARANREGNVAQIPLASPINQPSEQKPLTEQPATDGAVTEGRRRRRM